MFLKQNLGYIDSRGLSCVTSILLESKAKEGKTLASNCIIQSLYYPVGKPLFLVVVHLNNLIPIFSNLSKSQGLADVNQVENILLEARASKSYRSLKELGTNTRVRANSMSNFINICSCLFAEGGEGIDARDTLCEKSICREFGQLRTPQICGQDSLSWDPVSIYRYQSIHSKLSCAVPVSSNEHTIRVEKIYHRSSFSKELWVGKDLESCTGLIRAQHLCHRLCCADWHC
mmetsp:Transcript_38863/g.62945  ORF Transcript_38863/g.62945 Transcript_38863/m.62945 type:complete len:231 (-) Transcript_38863:544-1236(-)